MKIPVVGYLPPLENFQLESRHLGLVLPENTRQSGVEIICWHVSVIIILIHLGEDNKHGRAFIRGIHSQNTAER
ncbi:hypothetical protein [Anaerosporobacter faecicola]|uniref:hypothetical protein n=1 Tax=Anaerosporobacter faecicola TaxID=2718714 RepID=UPI00143C2CB3|nr:hypothetical protein [Anaerosporobacter faecicola]